MLTDGEKDYELCYSMKRIQMIEGSMGGKSLLSAMSGVPAISDLVKMCAYGLRVSGKQGWISPTQGTRVAETAIENDGFMVVYREVSEALERDCGFLFQTAE